MVSKLYKVLVDGGSCHGGGMEWSLPEKVKGRWKPGAWHEHQGKIVMCEKGLHLTTKPWEKWYATLMACCTFTRQAGRYKITQ